MTGPANRAAAAGRIHRRAVLRGIASASSVPFLAACGGDRLSTSNRPDQVGRAAFLVPLSGDAGGVGQIMREAASLGGTGVGLSAEVEILDSGSVPETAVKAAEAAAAAGARMIVGPLFAPQAEAVAAAMPNSLPVVTLSNDSALAGKGVFVFGVTPEQSARAVLAQAARSGKRRIALVAPPGPIAKRGYQAVKALAPTLGLEVLPLVEHGDPASALDVVRAVSGNRLPDAIYLPAGGKSLAAYARALSNVGVQLLGSTQWTAQAVESDPAFRGAWFATPDPLRFEPFSRALQDRTGQRGGIIAGLAFDAVEMARVLGRVGEQSAKGLRRDKGFDGVLGPYKFDKSGLCQRGLAVLEVGDGETTLVSSVAV